MTYVVYKLDSDGPLNTLSSTVLSELRDFIRDNKDKSIVIESDKKDFAVGADVSEFLPIFKKGPDALKEYIQSVHDLFLEIENHPMPTFALINGNCFGGALELVLSCDYRFALADAKFSFPEVKLGIIPGWGGCVRAPRLIGYENAATMITSGKVVSADEAFTMGLVDSVTAEKVYDVVDRLSDVPQAKRKVKQGPMAYVSEYELQLASATVDAVVLPRAGKYIAPVKALEVMKSGAMLNEDEALAIELNTFIHDIAYGGQAENMIKLFFIDQKVRKLQGKPDKSLKVGVIGGGVMGQGIAFQSAKNGMQVTIKEINREACDKAKSAIDALATKQKKDITVGYTEHYEGLLECDIVIEAAVEDLKIKNEIFSALRAIGYKGVIASNTSSIPLDMMPKCNVGLHYFNPVYKMPLVEVIKGSKTKPEDIALAKAVAATQRKTAIEVESCAGFLVNRCLIPYLNVCMQAIDAGTNYKELDKVATDYGWPMGPATLLDTIGLDIAVHIAPVMRQAYPDNKAMDLPDGLFVHELVGKGMLGNKTGKGIYTDLEVGEKDDATEVFGNAMTIFFDEVKACVDEGIVGSIEEATMALVMGLGFPPFREVKV